MAWPSGLKGAKGKVLSDPCERRLRAVAISDLSSDPQGRRAARQAPADGRLA